MLTFIRTFNYSLFIPKSKEEIIYLFIQVLLISLLTFLSIKDYKKSGILVIVISHILAFSFLYFYHKDKFDNSSFDNAYYLASTFAYTFTRIVNTINILRVSAKKYPKTILVLPIVIIVCDIMYTALFFRKFN